jgi:hypothetical protein
LPPMNTSSQPKFTFSRTQVITFDPLYACMDFAARMAIACMDSVAKYDGCCGLLIDHEYGGYSLIWRRYCRLASSGESTSTLSEDASVGRSGPWTTFHPWLFAIRFVHGSQAPVAWWRATHQVTAARCWCKNLPSSAVQ